MCSDKRDLSAWGQNPVTDILISSPSACEFSAGKSILKTNMSGRINLKDRHGNDIYFGNGGVVWFPQYEDIDYREQVKKIRHLELRDDDVILVAYPRSGTHWSHQILHMLIENTTDYVGSIPEDLIDWKPLDNLTVPDTPRVVVTHLNRFEYLPRQALEKKVKVVYCYRNPKDTWVSNYNCARDIRVFQPYQGTWPQFYDLMMDIGYWYGDWFDHVLNWESAAKEHPDMIFPSCYEMMKKDPIGQIQKIDQFLGLNRGRALCEQIADACQFTKLKSGKQEREDMGELWQNGADGMYRKGEVGDWKNWFTQAQSEHFDTIFEKRMAGTTLPFIFQ